MFENPSLTIRVLIGKGVGLFFGLTSFILLPFILPETGWLVRWGILLWYPTVGAIIGLVGVYTRHPILKFPLPWWVRAPLVGAWMNLVLMLFAYDTLQAIMLAAFGDQGLMGSPFWFIVEGARSAR